MESGTNGQWQPFRQGHIDDYGAHYKTEEESQQIAELRHEERLAEQIVYHGSGNVRLLSAGTVFTLSNTTLPEAEFGLLVTTIRRGAARNQAYQNRFTAIPSHRIFRPKRLTPWPRITGPLPARIATPNYKDAFLDEMGRYVVAFDFDRDEWNPGSNSRRVRLAKPFAGGNETGFHFPLLEGTEVAIAFTGGHPDRPYIAHAMHDSGHPDHVSQSNHTRNIIRTQSNNKLRMEDKSKQEHIKLSTEFGGKSQLSLGHLVDAQRAKRGEGFELRSDSYGAIRAGKGLFVSADAQNAAGSQQLDMQTAISQLEQAIQVAKSLNEVAGIAQADPANTDAQAASKQALEGLKEAGLILSAPAGIALTSPEQIQLSTGASLSLMKRLTVAAGEAISLFAQKSGIKLFAARGKVDIQAQNNALNLAAQKDVSISSSQGKVVVNAKEEILLTSGGAYVRIKGGNIELGCPGDVTIKAVAMVKPLSILATIFMLTIYQQIPTLSAAEPPMIEHLTKNMQTYCLGRYLIDLPQGMDLGLPENRGATVNKIRIDLVEMNKPLFNYNLEKRTKYLQSQYLSGPLRKKIWKKLFLYQIKMV